MGSEEGFMNMSLDIRQRIEGAEDQKEVKEFQLLHLLQSTQMRIDGGKSWNG
jgi:hypothetical protein